MNTVADKRWKRMERRTADTINGKRVPMSGGLERDGDVIDTKADVWHPELFVECKQRKELPLWDAFKHLRKKARRVEKTPVLVIENPSEGYRLGVVDLEEALAFARLLEKAGSSLSVKLVLDRFHVRVRTEKRNWCYPRWEDTVPKAVTEDKTPMLALGKVRCPGGLAVLGFP